MLLCVLNSFWVLLSWNLFCCRWNRLIGRNLWCRLFGMKLVRLLVLKMIYVWMNGWVFLFLIGVMDWLVEKNVLMMLCGIDLVNVLVLLILRISDCLVVMRIWLIWYLFVCGLVVLLRLKGVRLVMNDLLILCLFSSIG